MRSKEVHLLERPHGLPTLAQFLIDMKRWLNEGRIQYRSTILQDIEQAPAALIGLFSGTNTGKMLVQLAKDP